MDEKILFVDDDSNMLAAHKRQFHKKSHCFKNKQKVQETNRKSTQYLESVFTILIILSNYL